MALLLLSTFLIGFAKAGVPGLGILIGPLAVLGTGDAPFANGYLLPLLIVGDIFCGWRYFGRWDKRTVVTMAAGALVGVFLASPLLDMLAERRVLFNQVMGGLAVFFGTWQLLLEWRRRHSTDAETGPPPSGWLGALAGMLTAVVSMLAHQGGLVSNLFLVALRMTKEKFIATATGAYFLINSFKVPFYIEKGLIDTETCRLGAMTFPLVILGGFAGAAFVKRMSGKQFQQWILYLVLVAGAKLLFWPGQ